MNSYVMLMILSGVVILSFIFDQIARSLKIPSTILLIFVGIACRLVLNFYGFNSGIFDQVLPTIGSVGLVLIVLDGGIELKLLKSKKSLILNSFVSAVVVFLLTSVAITYALHYIFELSLYQSALYAIPVSIISSAIAIPSTQYFTSFNKEFIIYESAFSDIIGIMLFNFVEINKTIDTVAIGNFLINIFFTLVITILSIVFVTNLFERITHHIKFYFLIAVIMFIFSVAKYFHFSSLLLVFFFGLFVNNTHLIAKTKIGKFFPSKKVNAELPMFKTTIAEAAFLIRTFFFLFLGLTIDLQNLKDPVTLITGIIILLIVYIIRLTYFGAFSKNKHALHLALLSPRGLITVLLFYSIPKQLLVENLGVSLYLLVILGSLFVMIIPGIYLSSGKKQEEEIDF